MTKSPKIYSYTLLTEKRVVEMSKSTLTLDHIQNDLNQYLRVEHGDDSDSELDDEDGLEKAEVLAATVKYGREEYRRSKECFKCGELGHYAREYQTRDRKNNSKNGNRKNGGKDRGYGRNSGGGRGNRQFIGKYHDCGKTSHKKENCWSTNSEIGAAAVDQEG